MPDFSRMRHGLNHVPVAPSPHLTRVLAEPALSAPALVDWEGAALRAAGVKVANGDPRLNDKLCCCVPVGAWQYIRTVRAVAAGDAGDFTDAQVEATYRAWGGYDGTPATDLGCNSDLAGARWTERGLRWNAQWEDVPQVIPIAPASFKPALAFLGPVQLDLALPTAWQQTALWDVADGPTGEPGTWGAHRVCLTGYGPYLFSVVTWGEEVNLTPGALAKYALGGWACVSRSWLDAAGATPSGLSLDALVAEGRALKAA